jgi:hypothetical protein
MTDVSLDPAPPGEPDPAPPKGPAAEDGERTHPDADTNGDQGFGPTATVINNFYAEVDAHTVGVSGGGSPVGRVVRRESGVLVAADIRHALRHYLQPEPFSRARETLAAQHLVVLAGPEGCGKKAGTLELARMTCPDAESYTVFPPTRSLPELAGYKSYRRGQVYLLHDWMSVSADPGSAVRYDLGQLTAKLTADGAYMAITFEGDARLRPLLGDICVPWSPPDPVTLLDHCTQVVPDLHLSEDERQQLRARAAEIRSPRLIVRLAEAAAGGLAAALAEAGESENSAVATWFGSRPARRKVWSVTALAFLSGVSERRFERQLAVLTPARTSGSATVTGTEQRGAPADDDPFPQTQWDLVSDASIGEFITTHDPAAPVGSEHRPSFRTRSGRLQVMTELNRRFGDELWGPVHDWLCALADQPFGETQIAAGYGLALLARSALEEVEASYLTPWSAGNLKNRLMAVSVLWSMAEDDQLAPAALKIAVSWVRNQGQERAITAALALGGPLGYRYPSEAMRWLWGLAQRSQRIGRVARTAISQLYTVESEADLEKGIVVRFALQKIRPMLKAGGPVQERRAALAAATSILGTRQVSTGVPATANVLRTRPADIRPLGELWAATLNSVPHRLDAVRALHAALAALADGPDSAELASRLGTAILPRLTSRTIEVLEMALPDPDRAEETSAAVVAAFLGAARKTTGAL